MSRETAIGHVAPLCPSSWGRDVEPVQTLEKISIPQQAARLYEPFTMVDLAQVDDLVLSLFLCQGNLSFHRHVDQDELFLVHNGTISLESDWGTVVLRAGELTVAPKGVGHRSSSLLRSLVLLLQPRLMANRRNGHRRLFALPDAARLEKVSVPAMSRQVSACFQPVLLAHLDTFALNLTICQGNGPWRVASRQSSLILCYEGQVTLDGEFGPVSLDAGELVVVPRGVAHQFSSPRRAALLTLDRHPQPGLPLPD
jgi:mannose-6-phosphate isomerase-like protein (cupin superfamily)